MDVLDVRSSSCCAASIISCAAWARVAGGSCTSVSCRVNTRWMAKSGGAQMRRISMMGNARCVLRRRFSHTMPLTSHISHCHRLTFVWALGVGMVRGDARARERSRSGSGATRFHKQNSNNVIATLRSPSFIVVFTGMQGSTEPRGSKGPMLKVSLSSVSTGPPCLTCWTLDLREKAEGAGPRPAPGRGTGKADRVLQCCRARMTDAQPCPPQRNHLAHTILLHERCCMATLQRSVWRIGARLDSLTPHGFVPIVGLSEQHVASPALACCGGCILLCSS